MMRHSEPPHLAQWKTDHEESERLTHSKVPQYAQISKPKNPLNQSTVHQKRILLFRTDLVPYTRY